MRARLPMRGLVLIGVFSCAAANAGSQTLPPEMRSGIDKVFAGFDKPGSPGCAMAVYRDGSIAYARGYGEASLEHSVAITPHTLFVKDAAARGLMKLPPAASAGRTMAGSSSIEQTTTGMPRLS